MLASETKRRTPPLSVACRPHGSSPRASARALMRWAAAVGAAAGPSPPSHRPCPSLKAPRGRWVILHHCQVRPCLVQKMRCGYLPQIRGARACPCARGSSALPGDEDRSALRLQCVVQRENRRKRAALRRGHAASTASSLRFACSAINIAGSEGPHPVASGTGNVASCCVLE